MAARARHWESRRRGQGEGGREIADSDAGSDGPWYDGMETRDARVGKLSFVGTWRLLGERGKGHELVYPPGGHRVLGGKGGSGMGRIYM